MCKNRGKKVAKDIIGQLAEKKEGPIYTDNDNIMRIAANYYTNLFSPNEVNNNTQDRFLKNIKNKITSEEHKKLDEPITMDKIETAIFQMQKGKSPGLDGIPVEFYQENWSEIKNLYMDFINALQSRTHSLKKAKNTSVIKIIYKEKENFFC